MAGPLGITAVSLPPLQLTNSPTFTEILNETLSGADTALADIDAKLAEITQIQAALEAELPGMISDVDEIDAATAGIDEIQWGSPEPDLGPVTDYLTAQRDAITSTIASGGDIPALALTLPNGGSAITFGGPPEQGGAVVAGSAPYTLHLPIVGVNAGIHGVSVNNLSGPNPPFVSAQQGSAQETVKGAPMYVALVTINPTQAGSFTGTVYFLVDITIAGATGTVQRQLTFQVVVTPPGQGGSAPTQPNPTPPPGAPPPVSNPNPGIPHGSGPSSL